MFRILPILLSVACATADAGSFYGVGGGGGGATTDSYANCVSSASGLCASTDGPLWTIDGAPYLPGVGPVDNAFPSTGWTTATGTPNQATEGGCQSLDVNSTTARLHRTAPATPYKVMIGYTSTRYQGTQTTVGIGARVGLLNVANDDAIVVMADDGEGQWRAIGFTTWTTGAGVSFLYNPTSYDNRPAGLGGWVWTRVGDNGTSVTFEECLGPQGPCEEHHSQGRAAAPFAAAPDAILVETSSAHTLICHWEET